MKTERMRELTLAEFRKQAAADVASVLGKDEAARLESYWRFLDLGVPALAAYRYVYEHNEDGGPSAPTTRRIDAAVDGRCPCGAEPAPGSAWCVIARFRAWRKRRTGALAVTIPPEETAAIQQQVTAANPYANVPHYGSGPPASPFIRPRAEAEIRARPRGYYTFE